MKYIVTDNDIIGCEIEQEYYNDLARIADCRLDQLKDASNNDLWLFPREGSRYDDKIHDQSIISIVGNRFTTGNIMGFVGCGNTELTIRSRFSQKEGHDWFMQYMLQKVFAINVFNLKHGQGTDSALNITALMLPHFLQKALSQGVYREYTRKEYNDSRVRGAISISAHIKQNYPFKNGKISYTTREYVYDNSITQLIRHTIEFLKADRMTWEILYANKETQENIKQIINATPSYRKSDLRKVLLSNAKPKIHAYYSEYRPLQKLCLQILRREKLSYGESSNRVYGILFDGAWLWEEYLATTMKKAGFAHPENKTGKGKIFPFKNKHRYARYPDFVHRHIIADAKYKKLIKLKDEQGHIYEGIDRNDLNQMISYMHITRSNIGIFICPSTINIMNPKTGEFYDEDEFVIKEDKLFLYKVGELYGHGGEIMIMGVNVPSFANTYEEFIEKMHTSESILLETLNKVVLT
jgi:5-methylcytosine-specific restriction endonuclease McrBC regulatory subunit McrC